MILGRCDSIDQTALLIKLVDQDEDRSDSFIFWEDILSIKTKLFVWNVGSMLSHTTVNGENIKNLIQRTIPIAIIKKEERSSISSNRRKTVDQNERRNKGDGDIISFIEIFW
ncbi:hypothetical protein KBB05_05655 [Patescibacteria group bacterium]|nr:hypothetical protein [Patescibacteria group bacterium]